MSHRTSVMHWTPLERRLGARLRHAPIGQCLSFEQFMELARCGRRARDYHQQMLHIVSCPSCRRALLELRVLLRWRRPSLSRWLSRIALPQFPQWALASGVAASIFALALWTFYPRTTDSKLIATHPGSKDATKLAQTPTMPPQPLQNPSVPVMQRGSGDDSTTTRGNKTSPNTAPRGRQRENGSDAKPGERKGAQPSQKDTTPAGGNSSPQQLAQNNPQTENKQVSGGDTGQTELAQHDSEAQRVEASRSALLRELESAPSSLARRASELQGLLANLLQRTGTRSGRSSPEGPIRLLLPDLSLSDLLEETTPRFEWAPVRNAQQYTLLLRRSAGEQTVLEETLPAEQTHYQVAQPLVRGESYILELKALRGVQRTLTVTIRFRVMSEAELADLRQARELAQSNPLLSALLFEKLERYREAREAIERALQRYPDDEEVRRVAAVLRARAR